MSLIFSSLFLSSIELSLNEMINTNRLNKIIIVWKNKKLKLKKIDKYWSEIVKKIEKEKTRYLNTATIERECMISLTNDIFEGPKYLNPLKEFISLYFLTCFLKEPEKLLHKLALVERVSKSFFVRQL